MLQWSMKKMIGLTMIGLLFVTPAWADYKEVYKAKYDIAQQKFTEAKQAQDTAYKDCVAAQQECLTMCVKEASGLEKPEPKCKMDCGSVGVGCKSMEGTA